MKRVLSLLLAVILLATTLTSCSLQHFTFGEDNKENADGENRSYVTRIEWAEMLGMYFGMDTCLKAEPYFVDVHPTNPAFAYVQSCVEWEVFSIDSGRFDPDEYATIEFVATTAVYATGVDFSLFEGRNDVEKALNFACANDIVHSGLKYSEWATEEQAQAILVAAQYVFLQQELTPIDNVVINKGVNDQRETTNITNLRENEYMVVNIQPAVNDVLIAPGTKESPDGVAIKVAEVEDNGDGTYTIKTYTPELYEVFDEIEYAGVAVPEFEDIIPADGVAISQLGSSVEPVSYLSSKKPTITSLSCSTNNTKATSLTLNQNLDADLIPLGKGTSKESALSFNANFNFTKGTVSVSPQWENKSIEIEQLLTSGHLASPDAGEWFSKTSVFPDKTIFGPDPYSNDEAIEAYKKGVISADELREALYGMDKNDDNFVYDPDHKYVTSQQGHEKIPNITNKFSGGYEIVGSIAITDFYVKTTYKLKTAKVFGIDTGIPTGLEKYSFEVNYGASVSASIKGKIENELTICSVPVTLGGVGTLKVDLILYAELNGEIAVKASINNNSKTEYNAGKTKKTCQQTSSASAEANVEFETGPKCKAKLFICTIPVIDASVSAAVQIKSSGSINYSTEWTEFDDRFVIDRQTSMNYDLALFVPIVKFSIGTDGSTLANKLKITFQFTIVGPKESAAPISAVEITLLEKELIVWEEHLEIPKDEEKKDDETLLEDNTPSTDDNFGSNMDISSYYIHLSVDESVWVEIECPAGYDTNDFIWSSNDESVVSVENGTVTAKGTGVTNIKVESKDGKYYANCAVYVGE